MLDLNAGSSSALNIKFSLTVKYPNKLTNNMPSTKFSLKQKPVITFLNAC